MLQDAQDSQQRHIASAKSQLSIVSTVLVGWAVVITVAVAVLLVIAFTRLRRSRLLDVPGVQSSVSGAASGVDVASWNCDAEAGLPAATAVLESDMEPDDLPVDMSRLCSTDDNNKPGLTVMSGAVVSEDELNTRDIPRFVHTASNTMSA